MPEQASHGDRSLARILGLDGLRAIAFLMVFVSHKVSSPSTEPAGSAGVWLFFVLSGFLISRLLLKARERIDSGRESLWAALGRFYLSRTARIVPVYAAFLLVVTLLADKGFAELGEPHRQIANWLFLSNFYVERHGWFGNLGHLWSLSVEEQYYILFALLTLATIRSRFQLIALLIMAASLCMHLAFWAAGAGMIRFDVNLVLNAGLFAIGTLVALNIGRPLPRWLLSEPAIALVLVTYVVLPYAAASSGLWLVVGRASGLLVALLIVQIVQVQDSVVVRCLEAPWIRGIGIVSYGAYLFHPVISTDGLVRAYWHDAPLPGILSLAADLALALLLAALSWHLYEKPIRDWCRQRWIPAIGFGRPRIAHAKPDIC